MAWGFNADTDRCFRTTAPALNSPWTSSFRPMFDSFTTNVKQPLFGISTGANRDNTPAFFVGAERNSFPENRWYIDMHDGSSWTFGSGLNNGSQLATAVSYHFFVRYTGSTIFLYIDGVQVYTASITFAGAGANVDWGYNQIDAIAMRGSIAVPKLWATDLGSNAGVIEAEGQYRNPQNAVASIWAAWHAKDTALATDSSGNSRNITTLTSVDFVADPAAILGDDPAGGYEPPVLPFVYRRVVPV